jgi:hypothetical protein
MPKARVTVLNEILSGLEGEFTALELRASLATIQKLKQFASKDTCTYGEYRSLLQELEGRLSDEASATFFYSLSTTEAEQYNNPRKSWDSVLAQFPSAVIDIEESSKCLACGRHTASVFHLMRVMEIGLRALAKTLNDPGLDPKKNPNWGDVLRKCTDELAKPPSKRSPEWAADETFFSQASATLMAVKNAWRNPTMHVEINYDEDQALEVWASVKGFMRHLATKLRE